jgi:hypothetical protein
MEKGVSWIVTCFISLVAVVLVVLYQDNITRNTLQQDDSFSFQDAIGGVGMGAITVPSWNFSDFDPRLQTDGYDRIYPIPGGYSYSPDRLTMVSSFKD